MAEAQGSSAEFASGRAGDVGQFAGPARPEEWRAGDAGHWLSAHEVFGWCGHERDRSVGEEAMAWRLRHRRGAAFVPRIEVALAALDRARDAQVDTEIRAGRHLAEIVRELLHGGR